MEIDILEIQETAKLIVETAKDDTLSEFQARYRCIQLAGSIVKMISGEGVSQNTLDWANEQIKWFSLG